MIKKINIEAHPSQLSLPKITCEMLLQMFPFALIINKSMRISGAGEKLVEAWQAANNNESPDILISSLVTDYFKLRRPTGINFNFSTVRDVSFVSYPATLFIDD
jgi:guanylate cyclase